MNNISTTIILIVYILPILCLIIGFIGDTYTNGLYKVFGVTTKNHLYGFVIYTPTSYYRKGEFIKSTLYHTPNSRVKQWYKE